MSRLASFLSRALDADEREAVLGDLAERPQTAVRDVLGLVIRRQFHLWLTWQPWAVLVLATLPFSLYLSLISRYAADGSAITLWLYANNWDWNLFSIPTFRHDILRFLGSIPLRFLHMVCWSWSLGLLLGRFSRRSLPGQVVVFSLALILGGFAAYGYAIGRGFNSPNAEVFRVEFYRIYYPTILLFLLGWLPALLGMLHVDRIQALRPALSKIVWIAALLPVLMVLTQCMVLWLAGPIYRPVVWRSWWLHSLEYCVYWPALYWLGDIFQTSALVVPSLRSRG